MNAIKDCEIVNENDPNGNPAGGSVIGTGMAIMWQNGPLGRHTSDCRPKVCIAGCTRETPNGAFVETVIAAALQRIEYYQNASNGKFKCRENAIAITKIEEALLWLDRRTRDREARQVEGMHQK